MRDMAHVQKVLAKISLFKTDFNGLFFAIRTSF